MEFMSAKQKYKIKPKLKNNFCNKSTRTKTTKTKTTTPTKIKLTVLFENKEKFSIVKTKEL